MAFLRDYEREASEETEGNKSPQGIWRDASLEIEDDAMEKSDAQCPLGAFFVCEEQAELFYAAVKGDVKAFKALVTEQRLSCLLPRPCIELDTLPAKLWSWGLREYVSFVGLRAENELMDEDLEQRIRSVLDLIDAWEDQTVEETIKDCENGEWSTQEVRLFHNVCTGVCKTTSVEKSTVRQVEIWKLLTGEGNVTDVRKVLAQDVLDPFRTCWDNGLHFRQACELWPLRMYSLASVKMATESLDAET